MPALKTKNAPKVKIKVKERDPEEILQERAENIESRLPRLAEELANLELRTANVSREVSDDINRRIGNFLDLINIQMEEVRTKLLYDVLDFFKQCPYWEIKKIDDVEHAKSDAAATFSKAVREGWHYVGHYHSPVEKLGIKSYTLMIRPKGYPATEGEYLKHYEEFLAKKKEAQKTKSALSSKPKAEDSYEETSSDSKPKGKLKLRKN